MKIRIPSPSLIVAAVALLFALSGTAVAGALITGAQIQNNTVSSLDPANETVKSVDVKNISRTTLDVPNGTLRAVDFAPGQLPSGPAGPAGAPGAPGPQGAPGLAALEIVTSETVTDSVSPKQVEASFPAGKQVVGGGAHIYNAAGDAALDESYPAAATKWRATAYEIVATPANWRW